LISRTTDGFRKGFQQLPEHIQQQARTACRLFRQDPAHPSLRFKKVHPSEPIYSARLGRSYRALAIREGERLTWFWIGSHADYEAMLKRR
jgi:hypothetical protein